MNKNTNLVPAIMELLALAPLSSDIIWRKKIFPYTFFVSIKIEMLNPNKDIRLQKITKNLLKLLFYIYVYFLIIFILGA